MRISIVSDEISTDFQEALKFGLQWGIRDFEIRHLKSGRVPYVSEDEIMKVIELKDECDLNISAISPGLFRISMSDEIQLKLEIEENIYESFRLAEKLNTKNIIIFGFQRYSREPQTNYVQVIHILGRMASLAEKYGFNLLLENHHGYWADTGSNTAKILDDVNSKNLKANWDLANAAFAGEIPYPYGYLAIRNHVFSVHVKDYLINKNGEPEFVVIGDGSIDWNGQFRAIMQGSSVKYITIETHCKPLVGNYHKNLLRITNMLEDFEMDESFIVK